MAAAACAQPPPSPGVPVPEPTEALRPSSVRGPLPESAHVVDYVLDARYDEDTHRIEGRAHVTWRNRGETPVHSIPFHLYMNGFRSQDTAWMRQARGSHRTNRQDRDAPWGYIDVASVQRRGGPGSDGTPDRTALPFAEHDDPSVMTVDLDQPLPPGDAVELDLEFTTQLPKVFARTGFADRFVLAGQWFPKPGVRLPDGSWRAHVFTLYSEFFADFGDYEVHLDLPGDLTAGASGILVERTVQDDRQLLHYRAEQVHDFAWTAGPEMYEAWSDHEGIRIRALVPQARAEEAQLHIQAQHAALDSMQARFGPYPWSTITLVVPPEKAEGAGGMEYPTFYTSTPAMTLPKPLQWLGFDQRVAGVFTTVHEFGHQYFQGLLASDEFAQPWLDEGLNTFSNVLVYVDWHDADTIDGPWMATVAGHAIGVYDGLRYLSGRTPPIQSIDQSADRFSPSVGVYGSVVYRKTAATMLTLRKLVGSEPFDAAMRTYADRYRFEHPTGADLERTLVEQLEDHTVLGHTAEGTPIELDVAGYLDQALRTTRTLDFRVHRIGNRPVVGDAGWHRDEHGALVGGDAPERPDEQLGWSDEQLEGAVVVHRRGDFVVPVEIEVEFGDGTRDRVLWDGTGRYRILRWPGQRIMWASVDPDRRLVLESRRHDNVRHTKRHPAHDTVSASLGKLTEASALALGMAVGP